MIARIITKPTAHKTKCLLCKKEVKKGDKAVYCTQTMYPGERVGYICKCVKRKL